MFLRVSERDKVVICDDEKLHLTRKERELLILLASEPGARLFHRRDHPIDLVQKDTSLGR